MKIRQLITELMQEKRMEGKTDMKSNGTFRVYANSPRKLPSVCCKYWAPTLIIARMNGHSDFRRRVKWCELYSLPWCQNTPCHVPTGPSHYINDVCRTQFMLTCCNHTASQSHRLR